MFWTPCYAHTQIIDATRTTHAHDASRCTTPVRIAHAGRPWSSRTTTVESNIKSEHNIYLACEDSPQPAFFFCTFSCSRLALFNSFYCTLTSLLSLSQCRKLSAAFSTRLRKMRTLQRTNRVVLPVLHCQEALFFPVLHHLVTSPDPTYERGSGDIRLIPRASLTLITFWRENSLRQSHCRKDNL